MSRRPLMALLAGIVLPLALGAQTGTTVVGATPYTQTLSINPLGLPFGFFSAEYEVSVGSGLTVGVGGTYASGDAFEEDEDSDDARDAWVQGKLLYYPGEVPLRGFSVGLTLGYHQTSGNSVDPFSGDASGGSDGAPTVGVVLDYNWLIGARRRFLIGTGIGARRVIADTGNSPLLPVYPDGRLQIGLAF